MSYEYYQAEARPRSVETCYRQEIKVGDQVAYSTDVSIGIDRFNPRKLTIKGGQLKVARVVEIIIPDPAYFDQHGTASFLMDNGDRVYRNDVIRTDQSFCGVGEQIDELHEAWKEQNGTP